MKPKVTYDAEGDVLYVIWERDVAVKGIETDGMVKQYNAVGNLLSVIMVDFAARLRDQIEDADLTERLEQRASDAIR
jgi:hypothetical protein